MGVLHEDMWVGQRINMLHEDMWVGQRINISRKWGIGAFARGGRTNALPPLKEERTRVASAYARGPQSGILVEPQRLIYSLHCALGNSERCARAGSMKDGGMR